MTSTPFDQTIFTQHAKTLARSDALAWLGGAAVAVAGLTVLGMTRPLPAVIIGAASAGAAWMARRNVQRRLPLTAEAIADTLDASAPGVQSSAMLLLRDPASLSMLQRLQVARVMPAAAAAIGSVGVPAARRTTPKALGILGGAALAAAVLLPTPGAAVRREGAGPSPDVAAAPAPPRVMSVNVEVRPPAYTARPARQTTELDLEVEAGATVTWQVAVTGEPGTLRLATSDKDTLSFTRRSDGLLTAHLVADHPLLYDFGASKVVGVPQGARRLAVIADRAPVLTIVHPEERTTIESGDALTVPVEVLGKDDYGIAGAQIVATVTTGAGENVKFREQRLAFAQATVRGPGAMLWRTVLDLDALGVKPGDELYFHVVAKDRRTPVPNEGRSETVFIRRADTTRAVLAEFSGIALKVVPDYFRSQRQIIIDTEKLLAEAKSLPIDRFRQRSNDIGFDQHALRVRYGELVGDENESGLGAAAAQQLEAAGIETGESHAHAELPQAEQLGPKVASIPEDAMHKHDDSENATRLASSVKATLQDALREMWSAERQLRTYDPRAALPYEYRALEFLKQVQQAARVYVKRVGFEPPPLEPDKKRLTGKQDAIKDVSRQSASLARDRFPAVRALLSAWPDTPTPTASDRIRIQAAGEELAREALDHPGTQLDALRDLRRWLDEGARCADCSRIAQARLYAVVPSTESAAAPRQPVAAARRAYIERLRALP